MACLIFGLNEVITACSSNTFNTGDVFGETNNKMSNTMPSHIDSYKVVEEQLEGNLQK